MQGFGEIHIVGTPLLDPFPPFPGFLSAERERLLDLVLAVSSAERLCREITICITRRTIQIKVVS